MRLTLSTLAAIVVLAGGVLAGEIKSTTRLTIIAPGASRLIEITAPDVLRRSHVFAGAFIGEPAPVPDPSLTRYTIAFDIQTLQGVKTSGYVVQYCLDEATGEGLVYLPGPGDPSHQRNISTILRRGQDGTWRRASSEWTTVIKPYLR
jgi:hypothetical protein